MAEPVPEPMTDPMTEAVTPAIEVQGLTMRFGGVAAVRDLSFCAAPGEILGLLGANGAGKTTTIHILLGLMTPAQGTVRLLGLDLATRRRDILPRINFSSAYISMPPNLTVWENMSTFALLYGVPERKKKIARLLEFMEIGDTQRALTGALSSGQTTRLNLCKALLNDPDILFLDEPTASLDPDIAAKVRAGLLAVRAERAMTILYTSHNMLEVEALCDSVIFLHQGRAVARGTPEEIKARADNQSLEDVFISIARGGDIFQRAAPGAMPNEACP